MVHVTICHYDPISFVEILRNFRATDCIRLLNDSVFLLLPFPEENISILWQYDNASIHSARIVQNCFETKIIKVLK